MLVLKSLKEKVADLESVQSFFAGKISPRVQPVLETLRERIAHLLKGVHFGTLTVLFVSCS